jgi:hypothetical protein
MKIHWIRVIVAAVLFEVALIALTIPVTMLFGMEAFVPFVPGTVFVVGLPFGVWAVRKTKSGFVLHGALVGIVATVIYLALIVAQFGSLTPAIELYGPLLFFLANALKIGGCIAGAYAGARRRMPAAKAAES